MDAGADEDDDNACEYFGRRKDALSGVFAPVKQW